MLLSTGESRDNCHLIAESAISSSHCTRFSHVPLVQSVASLRTESSLEFSMKNSPKRTSRSEPCTSSWYSPCIASSLALVLLSTFWPLANWLLITVELSMISSYLFHHVDGFHGGHGRIRAGVAHLGAGPFDSLFECFTC